MSTWNKPAEAAEIDKTAKALAANGMETFIVADREAARQKVLALIPAGSEVLTVSSITLDETGIAREINESGRYQSLKARQFSMDREKQAAEIRRLVSAPDWAVGSGHAVTEDGTILVASLTGSQQAAYVYGAGQLVLVIGTNKIVKDVPDAWRRLREHVVGLESVRARKAYHLPDSFHSYPSKVLLLEKEANPQRIKVILVKETLGH